MNFSDFPLWAVKLIIIIVLCLLCMIFGAVPLKLSRDQSVENGTSQLRNLLISLSNCFAGGVFFSTVILDLFPMVKVNLNDALSSIEIETDFPLGDFLVGFGFILMLILEQLVHMCCKNDIGLNHGHAHGKPDLNEEEFLYSDATHLLNEGIDDREDPLTEVEIVVKNNLTKRVQLGPAEILHGNSISNLESENDNEELERTETTKSVMSYETFFSEHGTYHRISRMKRTKSLASMHSVTNSNFRAYVLVFAISLHSLFEGLSVGLMVKTSVLLQVFVALVIHKSIIAFSIGVQLVDADLPSKVVLICIAIFSVMTPIGIGLGMAILKSFNSVVKLWFSGVFQAIATGSFLFVTFFEVLPHELNITDDKKPLKILFVILGYVVITGICYYENRFHKISKIHPHPTKAP